MGALETSHHQGTTTTTISGSAGKEIDREHKVERQAAHSHKLEATTSLTIESGGGGGKFHMPLATTNAASHDEYDSSARQSNTQTRTTGASRTMLLIHQQPRQQRQQQQPYVPMKLSNLSPTSASASSSAAAPQPNYNNHNNNNNNHPHHPNHQHSFMKTTTNATSLVYQIVIISLILHEFPPLSSSTSSYQTTTSCRGLVAASLHSPSGSLNQRQAKAVATTAAAAAAAAAEHVHLPRRKRHLATATSRDDSQVDCHKLAAMWQYLHTSYPALASHLLEWSSPTRAAGKQADERFLWARSSQAARTIGNLLNEAERLTSTASGKRPGGGASGDSEHQGQLAGAAWLARVSTNPAYAKLVQHLRAKQMQQREHSGAAGGGGGSGSGSGAESSGQEGEAGGKASAGNGNGNGAAVAAADKEEPDGEQMAVAATSAAAGPGLGATYGRLVHYPHEIGNTDNSHGMARTLDKLRLLSHHNRQQQQQQQNGLGGGGDRDIEETNKIPLATDVDQMTESDWRRLSESATDAARQNFVYGKVLLRPSQAHQNQEQLAQDSQQQQQQQPGHHHYQRPLEVLQGLQHEQERQRVAAASGIHQTASPSGTQAHDAGFGRIVSGPHMTGGLGTAGEVDEVGGGGGGSGGSNNDKSVQHKYAQTLAEQQQRQRQRAQQIDELRALASDTDYRAASNSGGNDELANQQRFQTMAVIETRPSESSGAGAGHGDSDFDELGVFHGGPLDKPEVRLLRSAPAQQPPEPVAAKTNNNLNFVVD